MTNRAQYKDLNITEKVFKCAMQFPNKSPTEIAEHTNLTLIQVHGAIKGVREHLPKEHPLKEVKHKRIDDIETLIRDAIVIKTMGIKRASNALKLLKELQ